MHRCSPVSAHSNVCLAGLNGHQAAPITHNSVLPTAWARLRFESFSEQIFDIGHKTVQLFMCGPDSDTFIWKKYPIKTVLLPSYTKYCFKYRHVWSRFFFTLQLKQSRIPWYRKCGIWRKFILRSLCDRYVVNCKVLSYLELWLAYFLIDWEQWENKRNYEINHFI